MNNITLTGRLTKDCEVNQIKENVNVMKFSMAVERDYTGKDGKKPVDFINCEYIGKDFTKLQQYVRKGKLILINGSLNIDQVGEKYFTKVKVNKLELLGGMEKSENKPEPQGLEPQGFEAIEDDDIPF